MHGFATADLLLFTLLDLAILRHREIKVPQSYPGLPDMRNKCIMWLSVMSSRTLQASGETEEEEKGLLLFCH